MSDMLSGDCDAHLLTANGQALNVEAEIALEQVAGVCIGSSGRVLRRIALAKQVCGDQSHQAV